MNIRAAWHALIERKASEAGRLVMLSAGDRPQSTPRDYRDFASEGYAQNVVAYRAVNEVARSAASVPWALFTMRGDKRVKLPDDNPILELLRAPNPQQAGAEFFEAVFSYFQLSGNAYIEAAGPERGPNTTQPRELWPLRPDRMKVIPSGELGGVGGYVFEISGKKKRWEVDPVSGQSPVLHMKTFNPTHDFYGLSPIEPSAKSIDQRNEADAWNLSLLKNDARPSGALMYEPKSGSAEMSDEQFLKLKGEIEEMYSGSTNAGRPLLLDGDMKWSSMSMSPKDMDYLEAKNTSSRDIALAFGVPPQLLGIPGDSTFSNYKEARLALWEETVIPLLRHVRDELNNWLVPMFVKGQQNLQLDVDLDEVPALVLRREKRWEMVQSSDFLTINEKRSAVGLGEIDGGDELLVPSTMLPLDAVIAEIDDDTAAQRGGTTNERAAELSEMAYGEDNEHRDGSDSAGGVAGTEPDAPHIRAVAGGKAGD
jgi:HK97 family phage portal protein